MEETRAGRRHQHASHWHRFCHMPIAPGFLLFSSPAPAPAPARPSGASATGTVPGCGAALTFSPARPGFLSGAAARPNRGRRYPAASRNERANHAEKLPARASVWVCDGEFFFTRTYGTRGLFTAVLPVTVSGARCGGASPRLPSIFFSLPCACVRGEKSRRPTGLVLLPQGATRAVKQAPS